jgi:predicted metal-dependent phosphoesterase TrpH
MILHIDIHVHTEEYSADSQLPLRKILTTAMEIGLTGVCITDHETQDLYPQAEALSKESGLVVIVGEEYSCQEGHVLIFGAHNLERHHLPMVKLLDEVKSQDGIVIAAHPFRWDSPLMGDAVKKYVALLDGIEAFNGGATAEENLLAYEFAVENGLPMLGGSDAHHETRLGRFTTGFSMPIKGEKDFIRAITKARSNKKLLDGISVATRQGSSFVSAYPYEKRLHERVSPPPVQSLQEILSAPRNRPPVEK